MKKNLFDEFNREETTVRNTVIETPFKSNKSGRMEDTHTRATFLIQNDVLKELNDFCTSLDEKGVKTKAINLAISEFLEKYYVTKV